MVVECHIVGAATIIPSLVLFVLAFLKKKFIVVDVGFELTTLKTHGLSTTPFVKVLVGY